jgi:hypothetical protein
MTTIKIVLVVQLIGCICSVINTLLGVRGSDIEIMRYIYEIWTILHQLAFPVLDFIVGIVTINYLGLFLL